MNHEQKEIRVYGNELKVCIDAMRSCTPLEIGGTEGEWMVYRVDKPVVYFKRLHRVIPP